VAVSIRLTLDPLWGIRFTFTVLFPAVAVSAGLGGLGPGSVTTLLCAAAAQYFWIEPRGSWAVARPGDLLGIALFLAVGLLISGLNQVWRSAQLHNEEVANELRLLQAITDSAPAAPQPDALTREWLGRIRAVLGCDAATLLVVDGSGAYLAAVASDGLEDAIDPQVQVPLGVGVAGSIAATRTAMIVDDVASATIVSPAVRARLKSLVGVPLCAGERLVGVLHAGSFSRRQFTERDVQLLSRAGGRIAAAIERAHLLDAERLARYEAERATDQLRVALEAGRMGTWQYTLRTGAVSWSSGLEAIHGYRPGEFPGTFDAFRREIHPDDRDRVLQAISEAVAERRDHHVEYRIVRPDGTVRWVEGRGQLFLDAAGQPDRMIGVCVDTTERREAEDRFRLAIEAAPTAMILVDEQGAIAMVNGLTERMLGYNREDLLGQSVEQLLPRRLRSVHAHHRAAFLADPRQRPMGFGRELFALRKDGTEVPVEIGLSPVEMNRGVAVLAAVTDITERKRLEDERTELLAREQAARAEMERANRLKDEFLAVLSHELRTPLNAVLGYAQMLASGSLSSDRQSHAITAIQRNANAQTRLVESLLDLSRVIAGKLQLELESLDLARLVETALDVVRPDADAKQIAVQITGPENLPAVVGDGGRLQQVLTNLLANSIKFTPAGGRITVHLSHSAGFVHVAISDTGRGITPEFLPYVFDRFKQDDGSKGRSPAGLGLGLALVREMVQAHGGAVTAESPGEGRGSTFSVTLPLSPTPHPGAHKADGQLGKPAHSGPVPAAIRNIANTREV
jgi:PAS domain S-box-containing protein